MMHGLGSVFALLMIALLAACAPTPKSSGQDLMTFAQFRQFDEVSGRELGDANCSATALAAFPTPADSSATDGGISCQDLRREFRYVVYVGNTIYCYWDLKRAETGRDFAAFAQGLEAKITDQTTPSTYFRDVLRAWAAGFHDGHVSAMPGDDLSRLEILTTGVKLKTLAAGTDHERVVVESSRNPSLPPRSQVVSINGVPVAQMLDNAELSVSGSTRRMRRYFGAARLLDSIGLDAAASDVTVEAQLPGATDTKSITLTRSLDIQLPPAPNAPDEPEKSGAELMTAEILPGSIGYLRIDGFMGTSLGQLLDAAMARLKTTKALLIDVRKNGGGDQSGDHVLRWLTTTPIARYYASSRRSDFLISQRPDVFLYPESATDPGYTEWTALTVKPSSLDGGAGTMAGKPVAVLTSANCFSACDTFVSAIQTNGLGRVVGEPTGGGTGSPLVFSLPISRMQFRYSVVRGENSRHQWIEGQGSQPDIAVELTADDVGKDSASDSQALKAIDLLRGQLAGGGGVAPAPTPVTSAPAVSVDFSAHSQTMDELLTLQRLSRVREDAP